MNAVSPLGLAESSAQPARQLRVAFFSDSVAERNGAGTYYHDLLPQLETVTAGVQMFQPSDRPRARRLSVPMPGDPTQRLLTPNVPKLWRLFRDFRPDVVVSITPGPFGLLGHALARRHGCGQLVGFHTQFEELSRLYWNPVSRHIANRYLTLANQQLCRSAHATVVNNRQLMATVRGLGADQASVVGTPLPLDFMRSPVRPLRPELEQVLFAGRLAPEKNLGAVIHAARACPNVRFAIAGDGPLRRKLQRQAADLPNVHFHGWLDRTALREQLDASDLLLLPSRLETFGSIALEAMARGRPALVAAGAGIHEWLELRDGLITLQDGEAIADKIAELASQPLTVRQRRSDRAREAAERLNGATIETWCELIRRAAQAPR
ncbi:MAG: group 1 glycosyl transferase [Nevskiales bacterium]|nr:group 1 glycosyl transferase [Nevskiales bacterium]